MENKDTNFLDKVINALDKANEVTKEKEDELDKYGLTDQEKEHVKNDDYDPWNFEEEDLEEDDYYNEDDD